MKRVFAILLSVCMLVFMASCSSNTDANSGGSAAPGASSSSSGENSGDAAGYADILESSNTKWAQKLKNGETPLVGMFRSSINSENDILEFTNFTEIMESYGCKVEVNAFNDDYTMLIQQLENFVTEGGILAMIGAGDYSPVEDIINNLREQGIDVCLIGWQPTFKDDVSGGAATDFPKVGEVEAQAAMAWADSMNYSGDGTIHYAQMRNDAVQPHIQLSEGCYNYITENDARFTRTYVDQLSVTLDDGFNSAEEALTSDPDIRVFFTNSDSTAVGINNYLMSRADLDPSEFCVIGFSSNTTGDIFSCLDKASNNEAAVRGVVIGGVYIPTGETQTVSVGSATCGVLAASLIMTGQADAPYWVLDDTWCLNSFDWDYVNDEPENDKMPDVYTDYVARFGEITLGYTG